MKQHEHLTSLQLKTDYDLHITLLSIIDLRKFTL